MRKFYCGECVNLKWEDIYGEGICDKTDEMMNCEEPACKYFDRGKEHRHYIATLMQANRYRQNRHIYRMPDQDELNMAIGYAINFMKENWK